MLWKEKNDWAWHFIWLKTQRCVSIILWQFSDILWTKQSTEKQFSDSSKWEKVDFEVILSRSDVVYVTKYRNQHWASRVLSFSHLTVFVRKVIPPPLQYGSDVPLVAEQPGAFSCSLPIDSHTLHRPTPPHERAPPPSTRLRGKAISALQRGELSLKFET